MKQCNLARLKKCMQKAIAGNELTVGFLGGSITQGSLASKPQNTYAYRVFSWWVQTFPTARFHYVNAGIGGTTSHYGVSRVEADLLSYQPDFVIVDFSVNDEADKFYQETYEGVVRRILTCPSKPAVVLLNNVIYSTGANAQSFHNAVGTWYQLPYISMKDTLYQKIVAGIYRKEEITSDDIHPNDKGHQLVAAELIGFLETVQLHMEEAEEENEIPKPMTADAYENAIRLTSREISPILTGFRTDTEEKTGYLDHFKYGWIGQESGDRISFEIEASCIAVQYRKSVKKPALCAILTLDGDTAHSVRLDGNFEEDWGDCLYLEPVLHHGKRKTHTIEIEILPSQAKKAIPFYLMALIVA